MTTATAAFIRDLSAVLEKHHAGLFYTTHDNGIHISLGDSFHTVAIIGWPTNGTSPEIEALLKQEPTPLDP